MDPITLATGALALAKAAFELVRKWREDLKQKGEWTDEQEAAYLAHLEETKTLPHWQQQPEK